MSGLQEALRETLPGARWVEWSSESITSHRERAVPPPQPLAPGLGHSDELAGRGLREPGVQLSFIHLLFSTGDETQGVVCARRASHQRATPAPSLRFIGDAARPGGRPENRGTKARGPSEGLGGGAGTSGADRTPGPLHTQNKAAFEKASAAPSRLPDRYCPPRGWNGEHEVGTSPRRFLVTDCYFL